jgi:polyisoprenoid-binding protein YceI
MFRSLLRAFFIFICISISPALQAAAETLTIDPQHSYVLWFISHLGFSTQTGKWYVNGTLLLDKDKPQNSKVNATINIADIHTGIPELDKHLKSPLFFDVAKFPTATFVSDKVDLTSKTTAQVHGTLTLHGISKPVTLDVKFNKAGKNPIQDRMTVGFSGNTTIKRSDFGISTLLPDLSDEVKIHIEVEAYLPNKAEKQDENKKQ